MTAYPQQKCNYQEWYILTTPKCYRALKVSTDFIENSITKPRKSGVLGQPLHFTIAQRKCQVQIYLIQLEFLPGIFKAVCTTTDARPHFEWMQCMLLTCMCCSASQRSTDGATVPTSHLLFTRPVLPDVLPPSILGCEGSVDEAEEDIWALVEPSLTCSADPHHGGSTMQEQALFRNTFLQHILKYLLLIILSSLKIIQTHHNAHT